MSIFCRALLIATTLPASEPTLASPVAVPFVTLDLDVYEEAEVQVPGVPKPVRVRLQSTAEVRDRLRGAIRSAWVEVRINGEKLLLFSGNYHLPIRVGAVQIDCPVTSAFVLNADKNFWGLKKDARLRIWAADAPYLPDKTLIYPVQDRWFASNTQMANEPTFVNGDERPEIFKIYYHTGLDIGGCEGKSVVVAATDGEIVSLAGRSLPGFEKFPVMPRYDVVYLRDTRGWLYRYSHFQSIQPGLRLGERVKQGDRLGLIGKEGASGGWAHLHFEIYARQPSGEWGTQEGYAFLWEAYVRDHRPKLLAVARPHHLVAVGERVTLDGGKSVPFGSPIKDYSWRTSDGKRLVGKTLQRTYAKAGTYSEVLEVRDEAGNTDHDFAVVQVIDEAFKQRLPPTIHAAYSPTLGIKAGDPVTFKVRSFRIATGAEVIDFGDTTPAVQVQSDGNRHPDAKDGYAETMHSFAKPGDYVVKIERTNERGETATTHLKVHVE